jgi:putative ABC transport system permease protein
MIADFRYAVRMLLKAPAFTIIAVLTLALGIGANSAIFSVVDTVLLRPLPFKDADQLVMVWESSTREPDARSTVSFPNFYDLRDQSQSFTAMAAYTGAAAVLSGAGEAQEVQGVAVAGDLFATLGTVPMLGRGFTPEETKLGAPLVVVLTHGLWQRAFASDKNIVGREITISGRTHTVIGVMPAGWKFPLDVEQSEYISALEPLVASQVTQRGSSFLRIVGRMKPGVTIKAAESELRAISERLQQQYPDTNTNRSVALVPLLEDIVGDVRPALLMLLGAVALVLLIACANVANLLLARAAARSREIGIRTALGASRAAIVRQLLAESLLLALLGGAAGLLLAWWGVDLLRAFGPRDVPRLSEIHINVAVCVFTSALAIVSTLVFGLVPALQVSRPNVTDALQQGAKGSTGGAQAQRVRAALVVSQVALSLLLLAGAGLLIKSFLNLRATNLGFEATRLLVLDQVVPRTKYSEPDAQGRFYEQLLPKLAALPGVESVSGANPFPLSGNDSARSFRMARDPERGPGTHPDASHVVVFPRYFSTMKIPLRAGRDFDQRDIEGAQRVAIVNEAFVRRHVRDVEPIGQQILLDSPGGSDPLVIVGVVANAKQTSVSLETTPEMYQPFHQAPSRRVWLAFRTARVNPAGLQQAVRRAVHEMDSDVYVGNLEPMQVLVGQQLAQPRFNMVLLGVFAAVAMVLAAIGIYGVIAYSVAQRTREIGIRMALGAQRRDMLGMILRQSLTLVAIGLTIGVIASFAGTRLLKSLLYGVGAADLATYVLVVLALGGAAFLASYIPARRAMKVDPMVALRYE